MLPTNATVVEGLHLHEASVCSERSAPFLCPCRAPLLQYCLKHRLDVYVDESQGYMKHPCAGTYIKIREWRA